MEFNDNQAEILLQAVKIGTLILPVKDFIQADVDALVKGRFLGYGDYSDRLFPTPFGVIVAKTYEREQAEYQRGYKEGYDAGMYAGKHTGYAL